MSPEDRDLGALDRLDEGERRRVCQDYVRQARQEVERGNQDGWPAARLTRQLAKRLDLLIGALFRAAGPSEPGGVSLVALGGYGRAELFPYSDLDVLILCEHGEDPVPTRLVEQVVYPLWDAKLAVGHAVRGLAETLELATSDLTARTALLDARLLAGDAGPFQALSAAARREFFGAGVGCFVAALREERATRHRRFGETVYLLEPNLKHGKGGLRDLNTGLWAAKARFGVGDFSELAALGGATARQVKRLREAQEFLHQLRVSMHLRAGRAQDHLLFEMQEALAPQLFPAVDVLGLERESSAQLEPAVERMMHAFYRHARNVVLETEALLDRCGQEDQAQSPEGELLSSEPKEHLAVAGGLLRSREPRRFWEVPPEILRTFQVSRDQGLPLHWQTRDFITEALADDPGRQLPADARAAERWLDLLCHPEPQLSGTVLFDAHDAGLLAAIIPELEPCTGRIQHDLYHVYTVDLHSLYVVALLKTWRRGQADSDRYPMAAELMARVERPRSLFLAGLLHDVAKPLGHGHAEKGARLAVGVAARLGLDAGEQAEVRFLVEQHLTMAHLSQRRDLSDPAVIRSLAQQVGTVDWLRALYLLTLADTAMTAPGNLTEWKASLLEELYLRTYLQLSHGETLGAVDQERLSLERRAVVELSLRRGGAEAAAALIPRVPQPMLFALPPDALAHHLAVAQAFEAEPGAVLRVEARATRHGVTEVTICCWDSPGRLAAITGVMLAHRIEILAAQVNTLESPLASSGHPGTVVDIFSVRPPTEADASSQEVWRALEADLRRALREELSVAELVKRHTQPSLLPRRVLPQVQRVVTVDNEISERLTVIDVQAPDRLGVLYAITHTLSELDLSIHLSKVATEAGRVVDIFYVSDRRSGAKVTDDARLAEVRRSIFSAIEALEAGGRAARSMA